MLAKVFKSGNSQAVRLPKEFRFDVSEVEVFKRGEEVVLRAKTKNLAKCLMILWKVVKIVINKDGVLENIEILITSWNDELDNMVLNSIKRASPFAVFPESIKKEKLILQGKFNYSRTKGDTTL